MRLERSLLAIPSHSLEDFPLDLAGPLAQGLLAGWAGLWHPGLLAAADKLPGWCRADGLPDQVAGQLFVIPAVSETHVPAGWAMRTMHEGGHVVRKLAEPEQVAAAGLAAIDGAATACDPELVADFFALGFCQLQLELLTRQMRYVSGADDVRLERQAVAGARAALAGDGEQARRCLGECFETLQTARERFYPAEAYLVDLTLMAETTLGPELARELALGIPQNVLVTGELVRQLRERGPASFTALRAALDNRTAALVGGDERETELPLESLEAIYRRLRRGLEICQTELGRRPVVYGRRRFGLAPGLPQVLARLGYHGALHFTLDDGRFPRGDQNKSRWEGLDQSSLEILARIPLDAGRAESFLGFPLRMAETMDLDHVATLAWAHWPGRACPWYDALRRMARYAPVLGRFVTLDEYFDHTASPGRLAKFSADQYQSPYLAQAVSAGEANPISRWADQRRNEAQRSAAETCRAWAALISSRASAWVVGDDQSAPSGAPAESSAWALDAALESLARALAAEPTPAAEASHELLVNLGPLPDLDGTPGYGFACRPRAATTQNASTGEVEISAERLANRWIEIEIGRQTGGIRWVRDRRVRGNLLSQQLAVRGARQPGGAEPATPSPTSAGAPPESYTRMVADLIEPSRKTQAGGELTTRGRLVDEAEATVAAFTQTLRLAPDARWFDLEIEVEPRCEFTSRPWTSYLACRWAWAEDDAELTRGLPGGGQPTTLRNLEAPDWIEISLARARVALLPGGLPYHHRSGERMLDALLVVRGEAARTFRLGVAVNAGVPDVVAAAWLRERVSLPLARPLGTGPGWLFHLDRPGTRVTAWQPLVESGRVVGFAARVAEASGQAGTTLLRAFRPLGYARRVDAWGTTLAELKVAGDGVQLPLGRWEWAWIEARWA